MHQKDHLYFVHLRTHKKWKSIWKLTTKIYEYIDTKLEMKRTLGKEKYVKKNLSYFSI